MYFFLRGAKNMEHVQQQGGKIDVCVLMKAR